MIIKQILNAMDKILRKTITNDKRGENIPSNVIKKTVKFNQTEYKLALNFMDEMTAIRQFIIPDVSGNISIYGITPITSYYGNTYEYFVEAEIEYTKDSDTFLKGDIVKHVKTNGYYEVLAPSALIEEDMSEVTVYLSLKDNVVWVRPKQEFCDGRFVLKEDV